MKGCCEDCKKTEGNHSSFSCLTPPKKQVRPSSPPIRKHARDPCPPHSPRASFIQHQRLPGRSRFETTKNAPGRAPMRSLSFPPGPAHTLSHTRISHSLPKSHPPGLTLTQDSPKHARANHGRARVSTKQANAKHTQNALPRRRGLRHGARCRRRCRRRQLYSGQQPGLLPEPDGYRGANEGERGECKRACRLFVALSNVAARDPGRTHNQFWLRGSAHCVGIAISFRSWRDM